MNELRDILNIDYNWYHFILMVLISTALYVALLFIKRIVENISLSRTPKKRIRNILNWIILYFEPVAVIIALSLFILIRPVFHGLIAGFGLVIGLEHLKNYINGKILNSKGTLERGQVIKVRDVNGVISEKGKLGLRVKSEDGLHYIPYRLLVRSGYILSSGDRIGGLYQLDIQCPAEARYDKNRLLDILISSPYLDLDYRPVVQESGHDDKFLKAKLSVKEESHIFDLINMLRENDFIAELSKT